MTNGTEGTSLSERKRIAKHGRKSRYALPPSCEIHGFETAGLERDGHGPIGRKPSPTSARIPNRFVLRILLRHVPFGMDLP